MRQVCAVDSRIAEFDSYKIDEHIHGLFCWEADGHNGNDAVDCQLASCSTTQFSSREIVAGDTFPAVHSRYRFQLQGDH